MFFIGNLIYEWGLDNSFVLMLMVVVNFLGFYVFVVFLYVDVY